MKKDEITSLNARKDFPIFQKQGNEKPLIYLDTAATAQKPQVVIDTLSDFYKNHYGTVHRAIYDLSLNATARYNQSREKIQQFLGAKYPEEVIFTRGATESINLVANSFGKAFIRKNDEILISEIEHHSNIVPWQMLCEDRGAILRIIPVDDRGDIDLQAFDKLLSSKTKLVSIAHISNVIGTIHPIKEVIQKAHMKGAKVLIDGSQSAPHTPIDVQDLDADFFVFSGHKLYGPTGIGALFGKREILIEMPPYQGGGDMIEEVTFPKTTYNALPLKFEAGTPMIAEVIALSASIDYLLNIGIDKIALWEKALTEYAMNELSKIENLQFVGNPKSRGSIISFIIKDTHPLDLGTLLNLEGVAIRTGHHCAQPAMRRFGVTATARVSFGLYNQFEDIDLFITALKKVIKKL